MLKESSGERNETPQGMLFKQTKTNLIQIMSPI